jgi:hypothetical protein
VRTPEVHAEQRTPDQNKKMWAMLRDISAQVKWRVNSSMVYMTPEDWKDVLTAGLTKNSRIADGIEGGFVMLGEHTSKMTKERMAELIEFMLWFGSERNVKWTEEA